jgi:multidrug efflux pump
LNIDVAEQEVQAAINAAQTYRQPTCRPRPFTTNEPGRRADPDSGLTSNSLPLSKVEDLADTRWRRRFRRTPA